MIVWGYTNTLIYIHRLVLAFGIDCCLNVLGGWQTMNPFVGTVLEGETSLPGWLVGWWWLVGTPGFLPCSVGYCPLVLLILIHKLSQICLFLSSLIIFSSISLSLGTAACFRRILNFLQAALVPFSVEMVPREHDLGARCDHCFWGVSASGPFGRQSQGREVWCLQ